MTRSVSGWTVWASGLTPSTGQSSAAVLLAPERQRGCWLEACEGQKLGSSALWGLNRGMAGWECTARRYVPCQRCPAPRQLTPASGTPTPTFFFLSFFWTPAERGDVGTRLPLPVCYR